MIKNQIATYIEQTLNNLGIKYSNDIIVQDPRNQKDVHYCTNIAMLLTKQLKMPPIDIAGKIVDDMTSYNTNFFETISIAKPGFINIKFKKSFWTNFTKEVIENSETFGVNQNEKKNNYLVEFVSANPTGPLHVGHCRGAILGDVISNLLIFNEFSLVVHGFEMVFLSHFKPFEGASEMDSERKFHRV